MRGQPQRGKVFLAVVIAWIGAVMGPTFTVRSWAGSAQSWRQFRSTF